uniref:Uncharacterized protein n=1 Tax=Arundo donax TaxID=35708 RepID=A0A0A9F8Y8_ARUDO
MRVTSSIGCWSLQVSHVYGMIKEFVQPNFDFINRQCLLRFTGRIRQTNKLKV